MHKTTLDSYEDQQQMTSQFDSSVMNTDMNLIVEQERIKDLKQAAEIQDKLDRYYVLPMVRKAVMLRTAEHVL